MVKVELTCDTFYTSKIIILIWCVRYLCLSPLLNKCGEMHNKKLSLNCALAGADLQRGKQGSCNWTIKCFGGFFDDKRKTR